MMAQAPSRPGETIAPRDDEPAQAAPRSTIAEDRSVLGDDPSFGTEASWRRTEAPSLCLAEVVGTLQLLLAARRQERCSRIPAQM